MFKVTLAAVHDVPTMQALAVDAIAADAVVSSNIQRIFDEAIASGRREMVGDLAQLRSGIATGLSGLLATWPKDPRSEAFRDTWGTVQPISTTGLGVFGCGACYCPHSLKHTGPCVPKALQRNVTEEQQKVVGNGDQCVTCSILVCRHLTKRHKQSLLSR